MPTRSVSWDTVETDREFVTIGRELFHDNSPSIPSGARANISRGDSAEILMDLRAQYGSNAAIARAMGHERGSTDYKAAVRQLERYSAAEGKQSRGIGARYGEELVKLAPPDSQAAKIFGQHGYHTGRRGVIVMQYQGEFRTPSGKDKRERKHRTLAPLIIPFPSPEANQALASPAQYYANHWANGGRVDFSGEGEFTVEFLED